MIVKQKFWNYFTLQTQNSIVRYLTIEFCYNVILKNRILK
jgi:hypothetical protein